MDEVSFVCKRTVVSAKPMQPGKFCSLSVLDRIMECNHMRIVLYYRSQAERELGELHKLLRESISETLTSFPILTGRLLKNSAGNWMIKCNDAGVRMVEARVKCSVEEWAQNVDREKELKLIHWEEMFHNPYFWSTVYVQLTEFEGGGLAIGLSCTHLLVDPICATMFLNAWADTTLSGKMVSPPLFHPLPLGRAGNMNIDHPKPYSHLISQCKSCIEKSAPSLLMQLETVTLAFSDEMVQACIATASTPDAPDGSTPTPFEALAALFWVCISKVKGLGTGLMNMSLCMDMRKVLGLDKGFFGNCMVYNKVMGDGLEGNEISNAVIAIREVVGMMNNEQIIDLIDWLEHNNCQSHPFVNGHDLVCANLEGIDSYSAIFEECLRPFRVTYYIEPVVGEGQVLILPAPPTEGIVGRVVMVTLPENEAVKLCEDALLQQLSPTIWMGANKNYSYYEEGLGAILQ